MDELEVLRRLIRETCVVFQGRRHIVGRAENGCDLVSYDEPGDGYARLVLDSQIILTDDEEIGLLGEVLAG